MKQHVPEERLALYVSGDMNTDEIREHLEVCTDCRGVVAELEQVCAMLGGIADEPEQEQLAEVRRRVRARFGKRHAHVWQWGAAATAAVAAVLVICFAGYRTAPPPSVAMAPPAPPAVS
ncbi:MAG: anti-sigma factor family protein, partial [Bryobacteraceae bacterium]